MMNQLAVISACAFVVAAGFSSGCEKKPQPPAAAAAPSPAAAAPSAPLTKEQLVEAMGVMCRLCRNADVHHRGAVKSLTLSFADGAAKDEHGRVYPITKAEWDQVLACIRSLPSGNAAARALPASNFNYGDGRGAVRRFAYTLVPTEQGSITFEVVKDLGTDSMG